MNNVKTIACEMIAVFNRAIAEADDLASDHAGFIVANVDDFCPLRTSSATKIGIAGDAVFITHDLRCARNVASRFSREWTDRGLTGGFLPMTVEQWREQRVIKLVELRTRAVETIRAA